MGLFGVSVTCGGRIRNEASRKCCVLKISEKPPRDKLVSVTNLYYIFRPLVVSNMSRAGLHRCSIAGSAFAHRPSPKISPHAAASSLSPILPPRQCRTFFSKRSSTFWTQSFPQQITSDSNTPYVPPTPSGSSVVPLPNPVDPSVKKRERKQRYLDTLMDKAAELSLRCMFWCSSSSVSELTA